MSGRLIPESEARALAQRAYDIAFALELLATKPMERVLELVLRAICAPNDAGTARDFERGVRALNAAALPIALNVRALAAMRARVLFAEPGEN